MKKKQIGLTLGGGGARGLCHIEFIKALDELEIKPSIIACTSIGAIIGGFCAAGVSGERNPKEDDPVPNIWESLASSFLIMQSAIIESKKKISRPDIYVKPALKNIQLLNFDRCEEIIDSVKHDVEHFKTEIDKKLNRKRFIIF